MALPPAPKLTGGEAEGTSWSDWAAAVNDELNGVGSDAGFTEAQRATLATTYVAFKNFDGTPVTGKHVQITLTADGTDIDNIQVVTP